YPCTLLLGVVIVIQQPALSASIPLLVPDERLGNANGVVEMAQAGAQVVCPIAAGFLMTHFGLRPILAGDLISFALAALLTAVVQIPHSRPEHAEQTTVFKDLVAGFSYLRSERGLLTLIGVFVLANFFIAMAEVALQPMVLSFTDPKTLGVVLSAGGIGYVVGGLVMAKWGGPEKKVTAALTFMALEGVALFVCGLRPSVPMVAVGVFFLFAALPIESACTLTVFQRKVPDELRGRVLALATTLSTLALPLGYFAAGPLADNLLTPMLREGGALSSSLGPIFGTAEGRGIGLLMSIIGVVFIVICLLAPRNRHLKALDVETMELAKESRPAADRQDSLA
ncbi:MAG TPA: MFS transporter, partial [Streptomyces sp.]|nr:MFS transporter [Streptomyces sp.]